jgi:Protein of unknown function (DUF3833)
VSLVVRLSRLAALVLMALFTSLPARAEAPARVFVLERDLAGTFAGEGVFRVPLMGVERRFSVVMRGTWNSRAQTLTLREDFVFTDGEKQTLTWRFTKTGPGTYDGRREDVVGVATGRQDGAAFRLFYTADIASGGSTRRLSFSDVLYRGAGRTLVNEAFVFWYGVRIGSVSLTLKPR